MKPRFLLDEHVNRAIQRQLRRLDARMEVLAIGDPGAPPAGTSDPDILGWLQENGYILVNVYIRLGGGRGCRHTVAKGRQERLRIQVGKRFERINRARCVVPRL